MTKFKLILLRLKIYVLLKPFLNLFSKMVYFAKLGEWVEQHRNLKLNDYPSGTNDYTKRYLLYQFILGEEVKEAPINYFEFGVADAETFEWWINEHKNKSSNFYGFDTFTGLPEDWGIFKKGSFSNEGHIPEIADTRATLYKGLFQETLPLFLQQFTNDKKKIILLDADLYSSTLFVLTSMAPYLKMDDILIFDEFFAPQHEFLAFFNFSQSYMHIKLVPFAAMNNYAFIACKVVVNEISSTA